MRKVLQEMGLRTRGKAHFLGMAAWGCTVLLTALLLSSFGAHAQLAGKGAITGTVTDSSGAVIPGAQVLATNTTNGITVTTTTTGAGDYHFPDLDPGVYTVTTTAKGFQKLTQQNIHVNALESQTYNPVLAIGSADVQITVTAEPPQLETSNATLGATMENEQYSQLPIEMGAYGQADQRRATDFAFFMPGVQGNNTNGNATTNTGVVNGSGSRGAASDVYIDGIPFVRAAGNGDPRYVWSAMSVDAIDQFQVQTNGYSAMYEGQGVMNYSVKQGGQQYHGSVYEFFRNTRLDSWGFFRAQDPNTLMPVKPIEHMNEYGIAIGGPLIPFGAIRNKLFFFTNYDGFRYASENPTPMRFPSDKERAGDFSKDGVNIFDPNSYVPGGTCAIDTSHCRAQFTNGTTLNVIPTSHISQLALNMQKFLPDIPSDTTGNNYTAPNRTGLSNWSTTSRIDYAITSRDALTVLGSVGRQASSNPVGQTTAGRDTGPVPYNYGQTYAPKTAVWALELTHVFSPTLINQLKWGYARYNGPTFNPDDNTKYSATTMGLTGMPTGQAQDVFPIVTFSGGAVVPTGWGGTTESVSIAENYTLLDTVQWNHGKHSFTVGGQVAWLLYNNVSASKSSTPLTLANAVSETSQVNSSSTADTTTGLPYASFLLGQIDSGTFTSNLQKEFGARFRAISPYFQDDWKVNSKLTFNLGLRYDFYPSVTEIHNAEGFFNPSLANSATNLNGALQFTGSGTNTCNCSTPVNNYYKNWGPRFGAAYQLDSKTVIRSSWGVMFSHGDAVGGLNTSLGTLGFSAAPSFKSSKALTLMTGLVPAAGGGTGTGAIPAYTLATGVSSGPTFGTGYLGNSTAPSSMQYDDPYLGGRAPEYINWNLSVQRQFASAITATVSYVGAEGHFLQLDSNNARGYWADAVDPKYVAQLGYATNASQLSTKDSGSNLPGLCTSLGLTCPSSTLMNKSGQALSQFLKPFPFQSVGDSFGYVGNSNYHALQAMLSMRRWHGVTLSANYTFSKIIDDGGSFRTGYPIPAGTMANHLTSTYPADRFERAVSTSNQPQHFVATAVWDWPFGSTYFAGNSIERAILGGFTWSGVFQQFSGSPLALTESANQTNPVQITQMPILNPNFSGPIRVNGKWGAGTLGTSTIPGTKTSITNPSYIAPSTGTSVATAAGPFMNPGSSAILSSYNYLLSDAPRTAPYGLYGPSNYQLDLAMIRSFPLHITEAAKLDFRAEWYNITNHTYFGVASAAVGASTFGQATSNGALNRKSAQFSARIEF